MILNFNPASTSLSVVSFLSPGVAVKHTQGFLHTKSSKAFGSSKIISSLSSKISRS